MNACTRISNRLDSLKVIATESAKIIAQGKGELTTPKTNILIMRTERVFYV